MATPNATIQGTVDPNPANPSPIHDPASAYWLEWWNRENMDTDPTRSSDHERMPWQTNPPAARLDLAFVKELALRGLHESMFDWPLTPAHAKAIWDFRETVPRCAGLNATYPPGKAPDVAVARAKQRDVVKARKVAVNKKKGEIKRAKPSQVDKLRTELTTLEEAESAAQRDLDAANAKVREYEESGKTPYWGYGGNTAYPSNADMDAIIDELVKAAPDELTKLFADSLRRFFRREGYLNAINTYDGTFTYGTGFNITTGINMFRTLVRPPPSFSDTQRAALLAIRTYLQKAGINFADDLTYQFAHVEKRDNQYLGWAISNREQSQYIKTDPTKRAKLTPAVKDWPASGLRWPQTNIAWTYARHTPVVIHTLVSLGADKTLPNQVAVDGFPDIRRALLDVEWQTYFAYQKGHFKLYRALATKAAFTYLSHLKHFGNVYDPDAVITLAFSRQLVSAEITYVDNGTTKTTTSPISLMPGATANEIVLTQTAHITGVRLASPTVATDIQIARVAAGWARQTPGAKSYQWQASLDLWGQFVSDLRNVDSYKGDISSHPFRAKDSVVNEIKAELVRAGAPDDKDTQKRAEDRVRAEYDLFTAPANSTHHMAAGDYVGLRKRDKPPWGSKDSELRMRVEDLENPDLELVWRP